MIWDWINNQLTIKKEAHDARPFTADKRTTPVCESPSYMINIPDIVNEFNTQNAILIKNLLDGLLVEEQREIKAEKIENDYGP